MMFFFLEIILYLKCYFILWKKKIYLNTKPKYKIQLQDHCFLDPMNVQTV